MTSLRWVLGLGRSGRRQLAVAALLGGLASGAAVGLAATAAWLIARASQHPPVLHLMVAIVAVRAFGIGRGLLRYAERLTGHGAAFRILGDLRVATVVQLERVLPLRSPHGQGTMSSGDLLSRFVGDVDGLQDLWVRIVLPYASSVVVCAASVGLIAALVPTSAVVLAVSLVVAAVVAPAASIRATHGATARIATRRAEQQTLVLDLLDGSTELAVYGALPERLAALDVIDAAITAAEARGAVSAGVGAAIATIAAGGAMWFGLWLGAGAVDSGSLDAISLAVVALLPLAVHEVVAGLAPAAHALPTLTAAADRMHEVFSEPDAAIEPTVPAALPPGPYGLSIRDLHAAWLPDEPEVLSGIDLEVAVGSTTLIVGASGSGKSTLAAVILRLLDPSSGTVELIGSDGERVDIADLPGDVVRSIVGWCAQDAHIFDSTIAANLRLARPGATTEEMREALRGARLADWVDQLPDGVDTMVGEHGNRLSGGQRQRLALARVLLADRPIVIFDEPTEHLDEATAMELAADIVDTTAGRTAIVITHRAELFADADTTLRIVTGTGQLDLR